MLDVLWVIYCTSPEVLAKLKLPVGSTIRGLLGEIVAFEQKELLGGCRAMSQGTLRLTEMELQLVQQKKRVEIVSGDSKLLLTLESS